MPNLTPTQLKNAFYLLSSLKTEHEKLITIHQHLVDASYADASVAGGIISAIWKSRKTRKAYQQIKKVQSLTLRFSQTYYPLNLLPIKIYSRKDQVAPYLRIPLVTHFLFYKLAIKSKEVHQIIVQNYFTVKQEWHSIHLRIRS